MPGYVARQRPRCEDEHTEGEPAGYVAWFEWAAEMQARGLVQRRCRSCGRFKVWEPSAGKVRQP